MIDIVIQGPIYDWTQSFVNRYKEYDFVNKVIFSTWKDNEVLIGNWNIDELVLSDYPSNPGLGNRNLQLVSSLAGMEAVHSSVTLKVRSDMFVPVDQIWHFYCTQRVNDNILTLSLYPRFPFHPRDHVFMGRTKNMYELFDIPLDKLPKGGYPEPVSHLPIENCVRTETYIGAHYCRKFNHQIDDFLNEPYKYITDKAPYKDTALQVSNDLMIARQGFQPLPQIQIEFPKYYPNGYPFKQLKEMCGEVYHEDLQNGLWM